MANSTVDRMNVYRTVTSFSHILGNLTAIMEEYIKSQFPTDYFKSSYVTTEAPFRSIRDLNKKKYTFDRPHIAIDPKYLSDQESDALPQVGWGKYNAIDSSTSPDLIMMNNEFFIRNDEYNFSLGYYFDRFKFNFGITMVVDTPMMRMSLNNYLRNTFRFKNQYPLTRYIETMIPRAYIKAISDKIGLSTTSQEFLTALNKYSEYPILRIFRPATGTMEFFVVTQQDIQLKIPDYPSEDDNRIARLNNFSQLRFEFEVEVNLMRSFLLAIPETITIEDTELSNMYTARFAVEGRVPIPERVIDNQILYTRLLFEVESTEETIDLSTYLSKEINDVRAYVNKNKIAGNYITVKAYAFKQEIDLTDENYGKVNYTDLSLILKKLSKETVYTVLVYYDRDFIRKIIKIIDDENLVHTSSEYIKS